MKVTKKVYTDIKRTIRTLNEEGRIPTHKERRRSRKRKEMYTELGRWHGLSYDTVHAIGQSKSFSDYHVVCSKYKKKSPVVMKSTQQSKIPLPVPDEPQIKYVHRPLEEAYEEAESIKNNISRSEIYALQDEITILQSEMAIIKNKKKRWFNG